MAARTLHVRCGTWEQVDVFAKRKLRKGRLLSMKVPFGASVGTQVTLGLELPNGMVVAIDGMIQRASPIEGESQQRTWIEIELTGFTEEVLAKIRALGRVEPDDADHDTLALKVDSGAIAARPPPARLPSEARMVDELPADERALFQHLSGELRRLRQASVHDVLGVPRGAGPDEVRRGWRALVRRHHPDLVARRAAPAITHLAEELTILSNRAYDRLRGALIAEGRGAIAGPSVKAPPGWLVGFEDIHSADATPAPKPARATRPPANVTSAVPAPASTASASSAAQGGEAFEQRARAMLGQGDANSAREVLAAALVVYPRSKPLRSLYYVATALAALQEGEVMLATAQLETALAHHEQCVEAAQMLEHIKRHGSSKPDAMQRLFR